MPSKSKGKGKGEYTSVEWSREVRDLMAQGRTAEAFAHINNWLSGCTTHDMFRNSFENLAYNVNHAGHLGAIADHLGPGTENARLLDAGIGKFCHPQVRAEYTRNVPSADNVNNQQRVFYHVPFTRDEAAVNRQNENPYYTAEGLAAAHNSLPNGTKQYYALPKDDYQHVNFRPAGSYQNPEGQSNPPDRLYVMGHGAPKGPIYPTGGDLPYVNKYTGETLPAHLDSNPTFAQLGTTGLEGDFADLRIAACHTGGSGKPAEMANQKTYRKGTFGTEASKTFAKENPNRDVRIKAAEGPLTTNLVKELRPKERGGDPVYKVAGQKNLTVVPKEKPPRRKGREQAESSTRVLRSSRRSQSPGSDGEGRHYRSRS